MAARKRVVGRSKIGKWVVQPEMLGAANIFDIAGTSTPAAVPQRIQVAKSWRATGRALTSGIEKHDPKVKFAPAKIIGVCRFDKIHVGPGDEITLHVTSVRQPTKGQIHKLKPGDVVEVVTHVEPKVVADRSRTSDRSHR